MYHGYSCERHEMAFLITVTERMGRQQKIVETLREYGKELFVLCAKRTTSNHLYSDLN